MNQLMNLNETFRVYINKWLIFGVNSIQGGDHSKVSSEITKIAKQSASFTHYEQKFEVTVADHGPQHISQTVHIAMKHIESYVFFHAKVLIHKLCFWLL